MHLLIGYGNPGRGDDGLGPALADRIAARTLPGVTVISAYQLVVEHALPVARCNTVVFADAVFGARTPVSFEEVTRAHSTDIDSHRLDPGAVLGLSHLLFDGRARGYVLGMAGEPNREVAEGLSQTARRNLDVAERVLLDHLGRSDQAALH